MLTTIRLAFLAITLLGSCSPVHADAVYRNQRGVLRVFDKPCPAAIATQAPQGMRGYYRFAKADIQGDKFAACAALATVTGQPGVFVHVIYDDGSAEILPYSAFHDEEPGSAPTI